VSTAWAGRLFVAAAWTGGSLGAAAAASSTNLSNASMMLKFF